ncbi:MAG: transglutaminase-like domain-containing protein [Bacteroidota bacterium]
MLCFNHAKGQNIELKIDKSNLRVPRVIAKKPGPLTAYLIKNKDSDQEKFDALFTWVAGNIKYDFNAYFAPSGAGIPRIDKILKYRRGICLDYAYLMDSLCKLADITNFTVLGYAKDELFDVQDSMYADNHAWNAVKLDNKWFVYDVTWASGETDYKLTKFSQFIYNLYLKHPPKYKTKKTVSKKLFTINYCDSALTKVPVVFTYSKQKIWNKWFHQQLFKFKLKTRRYNNQVINPNYYLCDPDTFAINHFPDDPIWSLVSNRTRFDIEADSAFYHLNDSTFNHQNRYGRSCPDCDNYISSSEMNQNHSLRKASLKFNSRNRFITTICEYNIGNLNYVESKNFEDSLTKVTVIDTALSYLAFAQQSLLRSSQFSEAETVFQKAKNMAKANLLYKENDGHRDLIILDKFNIKNGCNTIKNLERKTHMSETKLIRRIRRINKYDATEVPNVKIKNTAVKLAEVNKNLKETDSVITILNERIDLLKQEFGLITIALSNNLTKKIIQHDSAFYPFDESTYLRYLMRDNYKKEIDEIRKKINVLEGNYLRNLDELIYEPALACQKLGEDIYVTINQRNALEEQCFKIKAELIRRCQLEPAKLEDYKKLLRSQNREDICWLKTNTPNLGTVFFSLKSLLYRQKLAEKIIRHENHVENRRFKYINKELNRRKHKYKSIILNNNKAVTFQIRVVNKEKRLFLKKLRRDRLEAAKAAKRINK